MKAWLLYHVSDLRTTLNPLALTDLPTPTPAAHEVLIEVSCCGVCHTELDEIEGRTPPPVFPVVPGHQVVGTVVEAGKDVKKLRCGDRVGVAWIHSACGTCAHCRQGFENLCVDFRATGRDVNGGYAEYLTVPENYAYKIPAFLEDTEAAPLLCAGAIGYRALTLTNLTNGQPLGLMGFGASGHLVLKLAQSHFPDSPVYVFARSKHEQEFASNLGAVWAGAVDDQAPEKLMTIIDTTPAWKPVIASLNNLRPGGRLVINAIRKEDGDKHELLRVQYAEHLWMEKEIKSVANITAHDVVEFLADVEKSEMKPVVEVYPMTRANEALCDLKNKHIKGARVLTW